MRSARPARSHGVFAAPSISVKLSALHPRYEHAKHERVLAELGPRLLELSQLAQSYGIGLTIDAEESDRLELSLDLIFAVLADASLRGWDGFGIVVQAYQKRAPFVIDYIARHGAPARPPHPGATGQGRVLGQRGQARAGRRPGRLSGVHAQAEHRRVLPGQCAPPARRARRDLPDVRHPQRADHRRDPSHGDDARRDRRLRVPETARHGRRPVRGSRSRPIA